MKLLTAWVTSAGLMLTAAAADAQMLAPNQGGVSRYSAVADVDGPYAAMPRDEPAPGYGPRLLPAPEVYTVVRENGFSPWGRRSCAACSIPSRCLGVPAMMGGW